MKRKKILVVLGTRPEAIKLIPIIEELGNQKKDFEIKVCLTAQHREMLDQIISRFNIRVDFDLDIMSESKNLLDLTSLVISKTGKVIDEIKPDLIIVQGDTTTTLAAGLCAFYKQIPLAHVEAGLRTYNLDHPFPEELNRQVVTKLASLHFCPTELNKLNLIKEGVPKDRIFLTGNTVVDSMFSVLERFNLDKRFLDESLIKLRENIGFDPLEENYILITGHRRENFGPGILSICEALKELSIRFREMKFVYPVHLNPNISGPVSEMLQGIKNIKLTDPIDYFPFVLLLKNSYFVITDSGGIQEEAPSFGKPVLVTREKTERPEGTDSGIVTLVGTSKEKILDASEKLIQDKKHYNNLSNIRNLYGSGNASKKIVAEIKSFFDGY